MNGELGNGGTFSSTKMINVAGGHQFVSLGQSHFSHICAIATRQASPGKCALPANSQAASPLSFGFRLLGW